jgi:hypothetical protein
MEKGSGTIIKLVIVLISLFIIDGGGSLLLAGSNLKTLLIRNHANDIEAPHPHQVLNFGAEEKYLETVKIDFSCFNLNLLKFPLTFNIPSQEFSDSIWQPPKLAWL